VTGVQTCALPISSALTSGAARPSSEKVLVKVNLTFGRAPANRRARLSPRSRRAGQSKQWRQGIAARLRFHPEIVAGPLRRSPHWPIRREVRHIPAAEPQNGVDLRL